MIPDGMKELVSNAARGALADALTNPAAAEIAQRAGDRLVEVQAAAAGKAPSALAHYAWAGGLGTVSVLNFYTAYRLPSEDKWLKGYMVLTGLAAGAGAYVNFTRARGPR
jgi:predicted NodU family carbamoyl transferase